MNVGFQPLYASELSIIYHSYQQIINHLLIKLVFFQNPAIASLKLSTTNISLNNKYIFFSSTFFIIIK
jgi:hypothetical protein